MTDFPTRLARVAEEIEALLGEILGAATEPPVPPRLLAAMRHAALGGGKRLRPFLVVETARLLGGDADAATRAGAAIELVHVYSLVHDDLPAMDDDDVRRGKPTVHVAFDEATAILAGDALQTLAFETLADPATHPDGAVRSALSLALARASGATGMAGGQMLDLEAEGPHGSPPGLSAAMVARLQAMKTGALLACAVELGAIIGGACAGTRASLSRYGLALGAAFQIADDILDVTQTSEQLGKTAGKDLKADKATYPALYGLEHSAQMADELVKAGCDALNTYGERANVLKEIAYYLVQRKK
jgi:farnesyl diphosphate synthase